MTPRFPKLPLTANDIATMRRVINGATPGPWRMVTRTNQLNELGRSVGDVPLQDRVYFTVETAYEHPQLKAPVQIVEEWHNPYFASEKWAEIRPGDAAFIEMARESWEYTLQAYERKAAVVEIMAAFLRGNQHWFADRGEKGLAAATAGLLRGMDTVTEFADVQNSLTAQAEEMIRQATERTAQMERLWTQAESNRQDVTHRGWRAHQVINKRYRAEASCECDECAMLRQAIYRCDTCGYPGKPETLACNCYDHHCSPSARGAGCVHGVFTCPVCDNAESEVDPWAIIRGLRAVLEGAPDEVVTSILGGDRDGSDHSADPGTPARASVTIGDV